MLVGGAGRAARRAGGRVHDPDWRQAKRVTFAVRPERMRLAAPAQTRLQASVQDVVFRGAYFAYELSLPGQDAMLFAYAQAGLDVPPDRRVGLDWGPADAIILRDAHARYEAPIGWPGQAGPCRARCSCCCSSSLPLAANVGRGVRRPRTFFYVKLLTDPYYAGVLWQTLKVAIDHHAGLPAGRLPGRLLHGALRRALERADRVLRHRAAADLHHHAHLRLARAAGAARAAEQLAAGLGSDRPPGEPRRRADRRLYRPRARAGAVHGAVDRRRAAGRGRAAGGSRARAGRRPAAHLPARDVAAQRRRHRDRLHPGASSSPTAAS